MESLVYTNLPAAIFINAFIAVDHLEIVNQKTSPVKHPWNLKLLHSWAQTCGENRTVVTIDPTWILGRKVNVNQRLIQLEAVCTRSVIHIQAIVNAIIRKSENNNSRIAFPLSGAVLWHSYVKPPLINVSKKTTWWKSNLEHT